MKTKAQLRALARKAVAAKIVYWDALRAFKLATAKPGNDWDDDVNDAVLEEIDSLAVGADTPKDLLPEHLDALVVTAQARAG